MFWLKQYGKAPIAILAICVVNALVARSTVSGRGESLADCPDMQQLEQAMGALQLNVGRPVVLNGLKSASHLNGSQGRLQQWDAAAERWQVFLITGPDNGRKKGVKAEKLSPVVEDAVPLAINCASELTESGTVAFTEDMLLGLNGRLFCSVRNAGRRSQPLP